MGSCFAFTNPVFKPAYRIIASITQSNPMVVTTTFAHGYVSGTTVRLDIPPLDGMQQANQLVGEIIVNGPTTFIFPVDSTTFDAFSIPTTPLNTCALVVPIGENNGILTAAVQNVLTPGVL